MLNFNFLVTEKKTDGIYSSTKDKCDIKFLFFCNIICKLQCNKSLAVSK